MSIKKQTYKYFLILMISVFFIGCASVPQRTPEESIGLMPEDYSIFLSLNLTDQSEKAFIETVLNKMSIRMESSEKFFENTRRIYFAVRFNGPEFPADLFLLAVGNYPAGLTNLGFCFSKKWKRHQSNRDVWQSTVSDYQVSVLDGSTIFLSNGSINELLINLEERNLTSFPPRVTAASEKREAVLYMPHPESSFLSEIMEKADRFPVEEIMLTLRRVETDQSTYLLSGGLSMKKAIDAKLFTVLIKMFLVAETRANTEVDLKAVRENAEISADGTIISLNGFILTQGDIFALLRPVLEGITDKEAIE